MNNFPTISLKSSLDHIKNLCFNGFHDQALEIIHNLWKDIELVSFEAEDEAELFLVFGITIGFASPNETFPKPQEISKSFLFSARKYFLQNNDTVKLAQCENGIAATFERIGEINKARIWVENAYNRKLPDFHPVKLYTLLIDTILDQSERKYDDIYIKLKPYISFFENYENLFLKGIFFNQLGIATKQMEFESCSIYFEKARHAIWQIGHKPYYVSILNNLAQAYRVENRLTEAFSCASSARKLLRKLGQTSREAFVIDSLANILIDRKMFAKAEKFANLAISKLEQTNKKDFLFEAIQTKIKIAAALGKIEEVLILHIRADNLACEIFTDKPNVALNTSTALSNYYFQDRKLENLERKEYVSIYGDDLLGVLLNHNDLNDAGLPAGTLAIVKKLPVKVNDLVAVLDKETNDIVCGFYSEYMGLISISVKRRDFIYDNSKIEILGRIIGKVSDTFAERPIIEEI